MLLRTSYKMCFKQKWLNDSVKWLACFSNQECFAHMMNTNQAPVFFQPEREPKTFLFGPIASQLREVLHKNPPLKNVTTL